MIAWVSTSLGLGFFMGLLVDGMRMITELWSSGLRKMH